MRTLNHHIRVAWLTALLVSPLMEISWAQSLLKIGSFSNQPQLQSAELLGQRMILEDSEDLQRWNELAQVTDRLFPYADLSARKRAAFYRLRFASVQSADDWSNQIAPPSLALFRPGTGTGLAATSYVKFTLLLSQPGRVYFQDSVKYPFHLHFARARLPGYAAMSVLDYNSQALYANQAQRMVLGSVLRAPDLRVRELGIELTGAEAFPATRIVDWFEAAKRRVAVDAVWRVFYMPSTEQLAETEANRSLFAARGIEISSLKRWATANACYSNGWALGRLIYLPSAQIPAALADGRLRLDDILVTDRVPAELPVLAGYLCLEPATPNSHVALLARSVLLPFAYANGEGLRAEIASLYGREVLLVVEETANGCQISLKDTLGLLSPERRREILSSKRGGPLEITAKATRGAFTLPVDSLTPADIKFAGGKASHFGFLRRSLPNDTPSPVLAITFDLWDEFMDQKRPEQSLRESISAKLANYTYPPNVATLRADLAGIRESIEKADFTSSQRAAVILALENAGLRGRKIRFRSSTNVEDSETFSGAGLYDSYSGCLEDDTDGDDSGPSRCDPEEKSERGVFRAIRKVYASFYNENAFLERLRHGVAESQVGMAILVHFSTPDSEEMANGVSTLAVEGSGAARKAGARIVTQLGAESVTNPDSSVRAEVVSAEYAGLAVSEAKFSQIEASSLTQGGATVMTWEADYRALLSQMNAAALAYEQYYPKKSSYELDFEFKRLLPGRVGLKQMRAVPRPVPVPVPTIP